MRPSPLAQNIREWGAKSSGIEINNVFKKSVLMKVGHKGDARLGQRRDDEF